MASNNTTTQYILQGIADPANRSQWLAFDERFRPIIEGFARRLGLPEHDAADAAQETLLRFMKDFRDGKYDPERGRLRTWLIAIAKNRIADLKHSRARREGWRGASALDHLGQDEHLSECWEKEQHAVILKETFRRLSESTKFTAQTVRAFSMVTVEVRSPLEVAQELKMSVDSVYVAKHRCLAAMREILLDMQHLFEGV